MIGNFFGMESLVKRVIGRLRGYVITNNVGITRVPKGYLYGVGFTFFMVFSSSTISQEISPQMLEKFESLPRDQQATLAAHA